MKYLIIDAFTPRAFAGNPAAVVLLEKDAEERWMAAVAREMDLSETAFLLPTPDGTFGIRWFTPTVEVALCGHATLASARALWDWGLAPSELIEFASQSGPLRAQSLPEDWIRLDFPATFSQACEPPAGLCQALGIEPLWVGRSRFDYLVQLAEEEQVRALQPDHLALKKLPVRGVIVTARGREYDFVSRFFAPGAGVPEDPVTGSAHCALTPFWAERLGKNRMEAFQASARGGVLRVELRGERVFLEGQAVIVARGQLTPAAQL